MNICSRCFHKDVCENYEYDLIEAYGNNEEACDFFADCEKIAVITLTAGDKVYKWSDSLGRVLKYEIGGLFITVLRGKTHKEYYAGCYEDGEAVDCLDFGEWDIGKTVFLSEKAAYERRTAFESLMRRLKRSSIHG